MNLTSEVANKDAKALVPKKSIRLNCRIIIK